jgi:hypothetical protein
VLNDGGDFLRDVFWSVKSCGFGVNESERLDPLKFRSCFFELFFFLQLCTCRINGTIKRRKLFSVAAPYARSMTLMSSVLGNGGY